MHALAQHSLSLIRRQELVKAGDRIGVAVSGGIDSVALLRLLLELRYELGIVISVIHFNHKLRGAESDADQEFVGSLAGEHGLEFFVDSDDVAQHAVEERVSVETAARELRYGFFRYLLGEDSSAPQGLKPTSYGEPFRGPEGPLFHGTPGDSLEGAVLHGTLNSGPVFRGTSNSGHEGPVPRGSLDGGREVKITTLSPQKAREQGWGNLLDKVATGHTLDDQAETVLMRVIRGSGLRGLGGIHPRVEVENDAGEICGEIIRPLLGIRRCELQHYLNEIGQSWREDSTNADHAFTRNRVRQLLIPLLEKEFNPAIAESLAELAEIARGEEDYWENEVAGWMGTGIHWFEPDWAKEAARNQELIQIHPASGDHSLSSDDPPAFDLPARIEGAPWLVMNASIDRLWFLSEPKAVQRRIIKAIGEHAGISLEFKHVEEVLRFGAENEAFGKELSLPLGWKLRQQPGQLVFLTPDLREPHGVQDYEYDLPVPGSIVVHEAQSKFEAHLIPAEAQARYNLDHLLDAESVPRLLKVRNWRPGDKFWPAHTKSPKKIKELLQKSHARPEERRCWPVVAGAGEIFWVRGFASAKPQLAKPGQEALLISERPFIDADKPDFSGN